MSSIEALLNFKPRSVGNVRVTENDPRRFYAAVEEASDNGELPLERCVTAMSLESQEPTTATNSNTETLSHIAAVYTRDTDAKKNIYPSISNVTSGISKSNTCSTCNKQNESCSARSYTPYSHTLQRGNHLRARRQGVDEPRAGTGQPREQPQRSQAQEQAPSHHLTHSPRTRRMSCGL